MTPTHLLDTGWIVQHLRGTGAYAQTLENLGAERLAVSIVSVAERYEGIFRARDQEAAKRAVQRFLSDKVILPITQDI